MLALGVHFTACTSALHSRVTWVLRRIRNRVIATPPRRPQPPLIMFTYLFITKYIVSFFSCIIVPNALRDIFMPGKPLFPDDAKIPARPSEQSSPSQHGQKT